jgi:hypothetical protein
VTTPPSNWFDGLLRLALRLLAIAVVLYITAKLILAVLPVLIGVGIVVSVGFVGWSVYQYWRSRW